MKINQTSNLRVEDFPDQAQWIGPLFVILNAFTTIVGQIFDQNIDFATNIKSVTKDFDFSSLTYPIIFAWPFSQAQPQALSVCKSSKDGVATVMLPAWRYNASTQEITVSYLTQVSSAGAMSATSVGPRYKFTIRATV